MFLGVIFVEKLPVLFDARGVHDNFCQDCSFPDIEITSRAVRDRYKTLERKHKFKNAQEERGTGLGGEELTEGEMLLEELIDIEEEN